MSLFGRVAEFKDPKRPWERPVEIESVSLLLFRDGGIKHPLAGLPKEASIESTAPSTEKDEGIGAQYAR